MAGFEQVEYIGNLGSDPEMRYTPDGTPVTNFSIAVNSGYTKDDGTKIEQVKWVRVSAWRRLAEVCNEYLEKGRQVHVIGTTNGERVQMDDGSFVIQPRVWQDKNGNYRASYEITARNITFLGGGNGGGASAGGPPAPEEPEDESIPF